MNPTPLGVSLLLIVLGAFYLAQTVSAKISALFVVGALLGLREVERPCRRREW
jgi:hypothetical protein